MRRRDLGDQGESQTVAAWILSGGRGPGGEAVEQPWGELRVDTRTVVGDGDDGLVALSPCRHGHTVAGVPQRATTRSR